MMVLIILKDAANFGDLGMGVLCLCTMLYLYGGK